MSDDRSWMYHRRDDRGLFTEEFKVGVDIFLEFAFSQKDPEICCRKMIRCPCMVCKNIDWHTRSTVGMHLYANGFINGYLVWNCHGESSAKRRRCDMGQSSSSACDDPYREMVIDAMGSEWHESVDIFGDVGGMNKIGEVETSGAKQVFEQPSGEAKEFFDLLQAAATPLFDGCDEGTTVLSWVTYMLNAKTLYNMSVASWNYMLKGALMGFKKEDQERLPKDYYSAKKMLRRLGLGYKKYDVCVNNCVLYYGELQSNKNRVCPICHEPRYKQRKHPSNKPQRDIPRKSLWHLPIIPRLQRLFMSRKTAEHMTWHLRCRDENEKIIHPAGGMAWQHFDRTYPDFASEPRNVRLGLCTDGFSPFGQSASPYSCWPVFVTVYNLPPSMCMKPEYIFLSLIISGPQSLGKNIDVLLRPLIDELKQLWAPGVKTYDSFKHQNFNMRAALMWTISDYPGYGMLSGWSTHGKLSCPYCMENTRAFYLQNGRKISFFDCHRQFLPTNHPFRSNKNDFLKNRVEKLGHPPRLSGEQIWGQIRYLPDIQFGKPDKKKNIPGFGDYHNWVKKSIFWELPYWKTNLIQHNLDVMHCEKNFFDNILNTVMNDPSKTKDNVKARMDIKEYCKRKELWITEEDTKPKATYVLSKDQRKSVCEWLKDLKLPDGYASNISRCVNMQEARLQGLKSHDCHVFMQRLLPLAFRDLLPNTIWEPLVEVSDFFRALCGSVIRVKDMEVWEEKIVETICKLERIFPPAFFDSMEHLAVHLPYEAKVGGPVQFRWMYPHERRMHDLKLTVGNKARVEGSICENYIMSEITQFCSHYFDGEVDTRASRLSRNEVNRGNDIDVDGLSIFNSLGEPIGGQLPYRYLTQEEYKAATLYVLMNCEEIKEWVELFEAQECNNMTPQQIQEKRSEYLVSWFKKSVLSGKFEVDDHLIGLAIGPIDRVSCYKGYIVNGYRFHTTEYGYNKKTMNSGVCVTDGGFDYYGMLEEVIELEYLGSKHKQRVVLFKCDWYDITPGRGVVVDQNHHLVDINPKFKLRTYEPFILASQAQQVYYTQYPSMNSRRKGWWAVIKTKARRYIEMPLELLIEQDGDEAYFQDNDPPIPQHTNVDVITFEPIVHTDGTHVEIVEEDQNNDVEENESDDEEVEFDSYETSEEENDNYISENESD
ncbi:hypothetical protein SLA2020_001500 [Shorea laevis]